MRKQREDKNQQVILCFGDSNTWGYDPINDDRYPYQVRWPGRLQHLLGEGYRVIEEGQGGRTTVWEDPIEEHKCGKEYLYACMETHSPVDLVMLMLGSNDLKKRFSLSAADVAQGAANLIRIIQNTERKGQKKPPQVLLISPAGVGAGIAGSPLYGMFTESAVTESRLLRPAFQKIADEYGCFFLDAGELTSLSPADSLHFTPEDHLRLAEAVKKLILNHPEISYRSSLPLPGTF